MLGLKLRTLVDKAGEEAVRLKNMTASIVALTGLVDQLTKVVRLFPTLA